MGRGQWDWGRGLGVLLFLLTRDGLLDFGGGGGHCYDCVGR